jgi:hypothetical protein
MWTNDQEQRWSILDGSAFLTGLLSYYAYIEIFYITRASEAVSLLQSGLIKVYMSILKYSIMLKKKIDQGSFGTYS